MSACNLPVKVAASFCVPLPVTISILSSTEKYIQSLLFYLSYGRICRGQVFVYLLQVWLSGFVGKPLVNIILESEFP